MQSENVSKFSVARNVLMYKYVDKDSFGKK